MSDNDTLEFAGPWQAPVSVEAIRDNKVSKGARLLYADLCGYMNAERQAWPGRKRLGQDLGISTDTVDRYLAELEKRGWIEIIHNYDPETKTYGTNRYVVYGKRQKDGDEEEEEKAGDPGRTDAATSPQGCGHPTGTDAATLPAATRSPSLQGCGQGSRTHADKTNPTEPSQEPNQNNNGARTRASAAADQDDPMPGILAAALGEDGDGVEAAAFAEVYTQQIGLIPNLAVAQQITDLSTEYTLDQFEAACKRARERHAMNLNYVIAVLRQGTSPPNGGGGPPVAQHADLRATPEWQLLSTTGIAKGSKINIVHEGRSCAEITTAAFYWANRQASEAISDKHVRGLFVDHLRDGSPATNAFQALVRLSEAARRDLVLCTRAAQAYPEHDKAPVEWLPPEARPLWPIWARLATHGRAPREPDRHYAWRVESVFWGVIAAFAGEALEADVDAWIVEKQAKPETEAA